MKRKVLLSLICLALALGCAGPNKLSRGLDERVNQLYVDNPLLAEVLLPFTFIGIPLTMVVDICFLNPWWFWSDVRVGRGSPYFYNDPLTPENPGPDAALKTGEEGPVGPPPPFEGEKPGTRAVAGAVPPPPSPAPSVPAPPSPVPVEPSDYTPYTVQAGDTLASISRRYYGKPHYWKQIYMANHAVLASPDAIKPGITLSIPATP